MDSSYEKRKMSPDKRSTWNLRYIDTHGRPFQSEEGECTQTHSEDDPT